jgi:hypothetical protein
MDDFQMQMAYEFYGHEMHGGKWGKAWVERFEKGR